MCIYNNQYKISFFSKKKGLFMFKRANKQKKNLILPLVFNKVEKLLSQNEKTLQFIMHIKFCNLFFVFLSTLIFISCTTDDIILSVGENIIDDEHYAYYTEDFEIESETMLAEYVITNNKAVALCGSYTDDYIGEITTNTVFKVAPNFNDFEDKLTYESIFDSLVVFMIPNDYRYGDSTKQVNLTIHELTEYYELDTIGTYLDNDNRIICMTNYSTTAYDETPLASVSFIPEKLYGNHDTAWAYLPDELGKKWFDQMAVEDEYYIEQEYFVEKIFHGLTIRSAEGNSAIVGFDMPDNSTDDIEPGIRMRLYYHNVGPYVESYVDFEVYEENHQYNQITADFSKGVLAGIEAGGEGIPSSETGGMTFIQSGIGLMTHITIPTLYEMEKFGVNSTIINMDLCFSAITRSFDEEYPLPTAITMEKLRANGEIDEDGLLNASGDVVSITTLDEDAHDASYSVPISYYAAIESQYLPSNTTKHSSLLLTARDNGTFLPNVNKMVIGDCDYDEYEMEVEMYYTTFE